jgi:hypothetical protein
VRHRPPGGGFVLYASPTYQESPQQDPTIALLLHTAASPPVRLLKVTITAAAKGDTVASRRDARLKDLGGRFAGFAAAAPQNATLGGEPASAVAYAYDWEGRRVEAWHYTVIKGARVYEFTLAAHADVIASVRPEFTDVHRLFQFE